MRFRIFLIIVVIASFYAVKFIIQNSKLARQKLTSTFVLPPEYDNLLKASEAKRINVIEVYNNKIRNPFAVCEYDAKYSLLIYKLHFWGQGKLSEVLNITSKKEEDIEEGELYEIINKSVLVPIRVKAILDSKAETKAIFNAFGDTVKTIKMNDSLIVGYIEGVKNISISYDHNTNYDLFVSSKGRSLFKKPEIFSVSFAFIKRAEAIYFILMAPNKSGESPPHYLLDNLVTEDRLNQ